MKHIRYTLAAISLGGLVFTTVTVPSASAMMLYKGTVLPLHAQTTHPPERKSVLGINDLDILSGFMLKIHKPEKLDYDATETITITVDNPKHETVEAVVLDAYRKEVPMPVTQIERNDETDFLIRAANQLQPGAYTLVIRDQWGREYEQEFTRGLISINRDKNVYSPQETAKFALSVVGDYGQRICSAKLMMTITDPKGDETNLTTASGDIAINPDCGSADSLADADYSARYQVGEVGKYRVAVTEKNGEQERQYFDTFQVEEKPEVVIKRSSLMSIVPGSAQSMHLQIVSDKDFDGTIVESLPESIAVKPDYALSDYDTVKSVLKGDNDVVKPLEEKEMSKGESPLEMPFNGEATISQGFGAEVTSTDLMDFYNKQGLQGHDGIDFALPLGTPLFAADDGKVIVAGTNEYGTTVVIQHSWGKSYYGHLSKTTVKVGYPVGKGSQIGYSGNSGESTGPHLHFAIRPNEFNIHNGYAGKIDPLPYLPIFQQQKNVLGASDSATLSHDTTKPADIDASDSAIQTSSDSAETVLEPSVSKDTGVMPDDGLSVERVKQITWHVHLKAGESQEIGYMFTVPLLENHLYLFGPAQLYATDNDKPVYEEQKQWQGMSILPETKEIQTTLVEPKQKEKIPPVQKKGES